VIWFLVLLLSFVNAMGCGAAADVAYTNKGAEKSFIKRPPYSLQMKPNFGAQHLQAGLSVHCLPTWRVSGLRFFSLFFVELDALMMVVSTIVTVRRIASAYRRGRAENGPLPKIFNGSRGVDQ
jgi:hypothetical protein